LKRKGRSPYQRQQLDKRKSSKWKFDDNNKNYIENKYKKDGYYNTKVNINIVKDTAVINQVNMLVSIDKRRQNKNQYNWFCWISDKALRKAMKDTNKKIFSES
jgi:outer membrane protein insertion porin family